MPESRLECANQDEPPNVGEVTKPEMTWRPVACTAAAKWSRAGFTTVAISGRS